MSDPYVQEGHLAIGCTGVWWPAACLVLSKREMNSREMKYHVCCDLPAVGCIVMRRWATRVALHWHSTAPCCEIDYGVLDHPMGSTCALCAVWGQLAQTSSGLNYRAFVCGLFACMRLGVFFK